MSADITPPGPDNHMIALSWTTEGAPDSAQLLGQNVAPAGGSGVFDIQGSGVHHVVLSVSNAAGTASCGTDVVREWFHLRSLYYRPNGFQLLGHINGVHKNGATIFGGGGVGTHNSTIAPFGAVIVWTNDHDNQTVSYTFDGIGDPQAQYDPEHLVWW